MTKTIAHVSELSPRLRRGREDGFVNLTIEDAPEPSDDQKLAYLREQIAEGDRDIAEGRVLPAEQVFARLRQTLKQETGV